MQVRADLRREEKLRRNMRSCISLVLESRTAAPPSVQQQSVDLFGEGGDSAYIREEAWGVYTVAAVSVKDGAHAMEKSFFVGSVLPDGLDGCLYLAEHQRSLSLVGSTLLRGKAYLPKGGVKPGYIDQRGYDRTELVDGPTDKSQGSLPAIDAGSIRYYSQLSVRDSTKASADSLVPASLELSFRDSLRTIRGHGAMTLSGVRLSGHILVVSDSLIDIAADASLDNVVLAAPVIRFRSGFSGRVQAFGTDSVVTGDNCSLLYPSALVLSKKTGSTGQPRLVVGRNSRIGGLVLSTCPPGDKSLTFAELATGSTIEGVLYVNGYLSLKGNVTGTTLTDYFIYRSPAVIYENYLADVVLDRGLLPGWYAGPVIFNGKKNNRVLQWVN
jgi:hypothetical protein